jgi:hypothetical protein
MASGGISAYKRGKRVGQGISKNHLNKLNPLYLSITVIFFLFSPLMYPVPLPSRTLQLLLL